MIALLGPPPATLVTRAQSEMGHEWPEPLAATKGGKLYRSTSELFGGPFFDENGISWHTYTPSYSRV